MLNQTQLQAECPLCKKKWIVPIGEVTTPLCPYCPSPQVKLTPLYSNKEIKQPNTKTE